MESFVYKNQVYTCENLPLDSVAKDFQTPTYVYSATGIKTQCQGLLEAFGSPLETRCFYAVKSCSNLAVLKLIFAEKYGADVVSLGEYLRSRLAGCPPDKIIFSGVGKTDEELRHVLKEGIHAVHVESYGELLRLNVLATNLAVKTRVSLRINPDIDAKTHPKISTGLKDTKFGVPAVDFEKACLLLKNSEWLKFVGVSCHIGSQISESAPIFAVTKKMVAVVKDLLARGFKELEYLDIGGGFGIRYRDENPVPLFECAKGVAAILAGLPLKLYLEPGRVIVGSTGVLLTRIVDIKTAETKNFVVVDASMSELMRPSLYDAYHEIVPVVERSTSNSLTAEAKGMSFSGLFDVVGPVCESADVLGVDRTLNGIRVGDLLAIKTAGAYGMSMASNYNSRPRPAEVLIEDGKSQLIRRREVFADLVAHEIFEKTPKET